MIVNGPPVVVNPVRELKLDLACGQSPKEGFEGVDLSSPVAKHKVDLLEFPWPWADSSVDELWSSHFVEHIPMVYVNRPAPEECKEGQVYLKHSPMPLYPSSKDLFFAFFDECWRILKPGGAMTVICPSVRNERAFWDPTHRRFISQMTFCYLSKDWRKANKLDHYRVDCDFQGNTAFSHTDAYAGRHSEIQQRAFIESWNYVVDYYVTLKAIK